MAQPETTAFLFPGQGSQSLGMMAGLTASDAEAGALVEATFSEASDALGFDLWALCQEGPEADLNRTENTQPAMLAADIATWRVWRSMDGPMPGAMAGHSLGEYAALVAGEALAFDDAIRLVRRRGQLMQDAVPVGEGAMAAILGLDDATLEKVCEEAAGGQVVSCANFNAPGQVVIAGDTEAVERACEAAREAGARRALVLPVSVPSHCALMRGAAGDLEAELAAIPVNPPVVPVWHNADVATRETPDAIRASLARQLWQPVQWTRTIESLVSRDVDHFVECGPGKVLAGLNKRIARGAGFTVLDDVGAMNTLMEELS
ncbi:MAG: ACP S-malonyltransferase [Xanthomonadales bacterium]|jgi:[acyl-carrier-protein] S-malonyltransferase|nr:ACP S-malonyltransferase [Xanthomonadales bacterium]